MAGFASRARTKPRLLSQNGVEQRLAASTIDVLGGAAGDRGSETTHAHILGPPAERNAQ